MRETCNRCKYGVEIIRGDYKCERQEIKVSRDEALYPFRRCAFFEFENCLVKVKRLNNLAIIPKRATSESAGFDLHSTEEFAIKPGEHRSVKTGLAFELPPGYVMLVYPRSGNAKKHGLTLSNAVGVIDSDYRGELCILLHNAGNQSLSFNKGDRIAQGIIQQLPDIELIECDELTNTERNTQGFGSTGR